MKVFINHKPIDISGDNQSLLDLLACENIATRGIAVAINNRVVSRKEWPETRLADGMNITVIHAVCGG